MARNLLQEAIADAKMVQEMAIANAKSQIEEAFKPHLASMISNRLRAESVIKENNDGSSEIGTGLTVDNPGPKNPSAKASSSSHVENPGLEIDPFDNPAKALKEDEDPFADDEFSADAFGDEDDLEGAPTNPAPAGDMGIDPASDSVSDLDFGGDEFGGDMGSDDPDELDLDAIIRELELDLDSPSPEFGDQDDSFDPVPEDEAQFESFSDGNAGARPRGSYDGPIMEDAEGVHSDGKSPAPVHGVNGGKKVNPGQAVTGTAAETMTEGEEIDLDEILREIEEEEASSGLRTVAAENVELKRSLREHRNAINILRGKLNEVNMLNAKLLYTNKLFKGFNLKLEQKMKVVETFDRASTLREVKLVYATLAESLKTGNTPRRSAKAITEGFASRPVGSTAPKSTAILSEGADMAARFKKLAGIID